MAGRRLDPEERAMWRRVTADVRPLTPVSPIRVALPMVEPPAPPSPPSKLTRKPKPRPPAPVAIVARPTSVPRTPGETLDGGWDRRLRRGIAAPDMTVDLHGYTLVQAHSVLEAALGQAVANGVRMILLVTGKPPRVRGSALDRPARGAIRAAVGDWLTGSRHATRIAAIRNAHPRHGGTGALYIILRRPRGEAAPPG